MPTPAQPGLHRVAIGGVVVAALFAAWGTRYNLNPDGISYLDLARSAVAGSPGQLVNGYWSPAYPVLLLPVLALLRGHWTALVPALHLVNLVLFGVGLWLTLQLASTLAPDRAANPGLRSGLIACCYGVIAIQGIGLGMLTPDFAVLVVVVATAWCSLTLGTAATSRAILLGLILGAGYWIKGILLPVDLLLLALLLLRARRDRVMQRHVVVAAVVFGIAALPLIVMVSRRVGHASIGEVGRLNYAWEVDGVLPFVGWLGDSVASHGRPIHPPRVINPAVTALEFATPVAGSYPLWYDPSYWYAGVRARFDPAGQIAALLRGAMGVLAVMLEYWAVVLAVLVTAVASRRALLSSSNRSLTPDPRPTLYGWCGVAVMVYALVHVEPRYLAGFVLVPAVMALQRCTVLDTTRHRWALVTIFVALTVSLVRSIAVNTGGYEPSYRPGYFAVADTMHAVGIPAGAAVAVVGDAFEQYGVVVSDTRVIAQVLDSSGYWSRSAAGRDSVNARLAATGAVALLANNVADSSSPGAWHLVPLPDGGNVGVRRLERSGQVAQRLGAQ